MYVFLHRYTIQEKYRGISDFRLKSTYVAVLLFYSEIIFSYEAGGISRLGLCILRNSVGVHCLDNLNIRINADRLGKPACKATSVTEKSEFANSRSAYSIRRWFKYL